MLAWAGGPCFFFPEETFVIFPKKILPGSERKMSQLEQVIGAIELFYAPSTSPQIRLSTGKSLESFQNTVSEYIVVDCELNYF